MNSARLKRILEREFKRNPAKTCVLLALLPVAAYFILPLVWQPFAGGKPSGPSVVQASIAPVAAVTADANVPGPTVSEKSWHQVAGSIAADPRMKAAPVMGLRNPFERDLSALQAAAAEQKEQAQEPVEVRPQPRRPEEFGLQLSATIVGSQLRLATINGRQYRENSAVAIPQDHSGQEGTQLSPTANSFMLKTVTKKFVVLEREGKLYRLPLAR